jgi:hypothetical protein
MESLGRCSTVPMFVVFSIGVGIVSGCEDGHHSAPSIPAYQWHSFYGSPLEERAYAVATDSGNNAYLVGRSRDTWNGPAGEAPLNAHSNPGVNADIHVIKLNADGGYRWHAFYGCSSGPDYAFAVATDAGGNVYVTGFSYDTWDGPESESPKHAFEGGDKDLFVLKLDGDGAYQWHTFYGSDKAEDEGQGIALDGSGKIYVSVKSYSTWNGPSGATPKHAYSGGTYAESQTDVAVLKLDGNGEYLWHTFYGSETYVDSENPGEEPTSIAVDGDSNVYVAGFCIDNWLSDSTEPLHAFTGGSNDSFVLKLTGEGIYEWHTLYGSLDKDWANGVAVTGGNIYVTGFSGDSWTGPTGQSPKHAYSGSHDIMVLKLSTAGTYAWHTFYGSASADDYGLAVVHDGSSGLYIAGRSLGGWQGDNGTEPRNAYTGNADVMLLGLSDSGDYRWHSFYGSAENDYGTGIALDDRGAIHVSGYSAASWDGPAGASPLHAYTPGSPDVTAPDMFDLLLE